MKFQELKLPQKRQEIFFFVTVVSNNSEASDSTTNNTEDKDWAWRLKRCEGKVKHETVKSPNGRRCESWEPDHKQGEKIQ